MKNKLIEEFKKSAKKRGVTLPKDIFVDKNVHGFEDGGKFWRYVLDADPPSVGMYECKELDCRKRILGDSDAHIGDNEIKEKLGILREKLKQVSLSGMREEPERQDAASVDADDVVISRLAGMTSCEYDRVRKHEAAKLGVRVSTLDKDVEKARRSRRLQWQPKASGQLEFDL